MKVSSHSLTSIGPLIFGYVRMKASTWSCFDRESSSLDVQRHTISNQTRNALKRSKTTDPWFSKCMFIYSNTPKREDSSMSNNNSTRLPRERPWKSAHSQISGDPHLQSRLQFPSLLPMAQASSSCLGLPSQDIGLQRTGRWCQPVKVARCILRRCSPTVLWRERGSNLVVRIWDTNSLKCRFISKRYFYL